MTGDDELLEFVIRDSYTPATLPMARLAEYLADLAALLGEEERVHFVELRESSAAVIHSIEHDAIRDVHDRVQLVGEGAGPQSALTAMLRIEQNLREDRAHAVLRKVGDERGRLLYFPGSQGDMAQVETYGPFHEQGHLYGIPISVGGKKALVNVNLQDGDRTYYCEATRDVALQISPLLFNFHLRVFGSGRYYRDGNGEWEMRSFRIHGFDKLDRRPLDETLDQLGKISVRTKLDKDIVERLASLREA